MNRRSVRSLPALAAACALLLASAPAAFAQDEAPAAPAAEERERLPYELRQALIGALAKRVGEIRDEKDAEGVRNKRASYSKAFERVDDSTYLGSYHVDTAGDAELETKRVQVTLKKEGNSWKVAEEKVQDTFVSQYRLRGGTCYEFDKFAFDEHGLQVTASDGGICEWYVNGEVFTVALAAKDLRYSYEPPSYQYFDSMHPLLMKNRASELVFDPSWMELTCDPGMCEELLSDKYFSGLKRLAPADRPTDMQLGASKNLPAKLVEIWEKEKKDRAEQRKENPFSGYYVPFEPEREYYLVELFKNDDHNVYLNYDSLGGYELTYGVNQGGTDPLALRGTVYGYYTPETLERDPIAVIEARDDYQARFYELYKVDGKVEAGLDDPEIFRGDIQYGVRVKQDSQILPFFIASIPAAPGESSEKASMFINSIRLDGEELTWVKTSPFSGLVVFPEPVAAGTKLDLEMEFSTRAIAKVNHAFSQMYRGGWLPFVRFGDFIDEFQLTISTPAQYKTLGIGRKVWEKKEGDVMTTHWVADSPVVFPTIIFGKYEEATPGFDAKKLDGTVIPVTVHVDEVSTIQIGGSQNDTSAARGIRVKQLKPIAEQAANAINLYQEISGVEYPYGELNLVNDPAPALYGQAPSSLIYLGSLVFRGEGTMAGGSGGNSANISKFLKSVTAHEVGHQWWGSAIANKNQRNYWFVESLAEYFSGIYLEAVFGYDEYLEQVEDWERNIRNTDQWVSVQNADTLWQGENRGAARQSAIYNKGPYAFHILRKTFGDEKFFAFLKQFTQELAEKGEIVTADIQEASERAFAVTDPDGNVLPVDLSWFFNQWIRSPYIPQYKFDWTTRKNEEGKWVVEGQITQRLLVGNKAKYEVVPDKTVRGVASITVEAQGGEKFRQRILVENEVTPFAFIVPNKPVDLILNEEGDMLAHETVENQRKW